jgi:hypothetical protein
MHSMALLVDWKIKKVFLIPELIFTLGVKNTWSYAVQVRVHCVVLTILFNLQYLAQDDTT